jgi:hypothetical protein
MLAGGPAAAQTLTRTQDLSFGAFAAGTGGTVTITPQGARTATGDVALIGNSQGSPAAFDASGSANATYQITLPADGTVTLTGSNGGSMSLSSFASSPSSQGQLSSAGTQTLQVGATLGVGSNQAPGTYSGSFNVTVVFQ